MIEARFDDLVAGAERAFRLVEPVGVIEARRPSEVAGAIDAAESSASRGLWAAGFVAYEAAPGLDPELSVHVRAPDDPFAELPLAWFALFSIIGFPLLMNTAMQYAPASHGAVVLAVLPLLTELVGQDIQLHQTAARLFPPGPTFTSPFHSDITRVAGISHEHMSSFLVKIHFFIEDLTPDQGCLAFIPGSQQYPASHVDFLASLPTLEQALGMLARVLAEPASMFARAVKAVADKQGGGEAEPAAAEATAEPA